MKLTPDMFEKEVSDAASAFDRHIVCLDKSPAECRSSLDSLLQKALDAYANREIGLRHGIALDGEVTVILIQVGDQKIPICGIYFNLHSPYHEQRQSVGK